MPCIWVRVGSNSSQGRVGLEVEMNYVWSTFSDITRNGRDRRRIVMEADPLDEASFKWLCQSMAFNSNRQSTTMK